ncbi:MAG: hypothetical protein QXJ96_03310 [Candidatus Aenigmatarchaeota archaeon]|nr:hypothetical protein [Candidatus Aenigmarchaeota archaeon]
MKGSIYTWAAVIALSIIATFFTIITMLSSSKEIRLTDEVGKGINAINLFYLVQNILEERVKLEVNVIALELGNDCGGLECGEHCRWCEEKPKLEDLKKEYASKLKSAIEKIKFTENLGKFNLQNPKLKEIRIRDEEIEIELESHMINYSLNDFNLNVSNGTLIFIEKNRYPLFLKIGRDFVENDLTKNLDEELKNVKTKASLTLEGRCATTDELLRLTDFDTLEDIIRDILNKINSKDPYKKENCKAELGAFSKQAILKYYNTVWISEEPPICYAEASFSFQLEYKINFVCIDENKKIPKHGSAELENLTLKFFVNVNSIVDDGKSISKIISA